MVVCPVSDAQCEPPVRTGAPRESGVFVQKLPHSGYYSSFRRRKLGLFAVVCKKCLVAGRVQGVFYRATAARRAQELTIRGYARNLPDGRVEVLACGEEESVRTFVSWLWTGSSASKVTAVDVTDVPADSVQLTATFQTS
jgi:acylphosphatase